MIDVQGLPQPTRCDVQIFKNISTSAGTQGFTWTRPRGASMSHILAIGGGGGGGGGFAATAGNPRGGGGGGGSAGFTSLVIPSIFLPKNIHVQVGQGSIGVSSGTAVNGGDSFILASPSEALTGGPDVILTAFGASGGASGSAGAAGTGGAAGPIATIANNLFSRLGAVQFSAGVNGTAGGAQTGANGTTAQIPGTALLLPGLGGAGSQSANFVGGSYTDSSGTFLEIWRPAAPASGSNKGSDGPTLWEPLFSYGGTGGSSNNSGAGGAGGRGGYGAGGGGGGAGTSAGRGGDGGDGLVIIVSW